MSLINLKSISVGPKAKVFSTNSLGTFIADIESTESMSPTNALAPANNQYNMFDLDNDNMIHNIYPIDDIKVRAFHYTKKQSELTSTIDDYIETYIPPIEYDQICQHGDYTFMLSDLTNESPQSPYQLSADVSNYPTIEYVKTIQSIPTNTFVYPSSAVINSATDLVPLYNLSAVQYNYCVEMPMNDNYFFYRDGQALGEAFNTKNAYDAFYNMNSLVVSTAANEVSATLSDARSYKKIGSTGDTLWVTYNIDREYFSTEPVSASIIPVEELTTAKLSAYSIASIPMSGQLARYTPSTITVANSTVDRANGSYAYSTIYDGKPLWKNDYYTFDEMSIEVVSLDLLSVAGTYARNGTSSWTSSAATIYAAVSSGLDVWYLYGTDALSGSVNMWSPRLSAYPPFNDWTMLEPIAADPITLSYTIPDTTIDEYNIRWVETSDQWQLIALSGLEASPTETVYYTHSDDTYLPMKTEWLSGGVEADLTLSYLPSYKQYEMVETIESMNRFAPIEGHKSNLYSINIQNAKLNSTDALTDTQKNNIKKSINNIIRDITKVTMPLNTQLFNVYWTGE